MIMADPQNMNAARGTYESFIGTLKWALPVIAAIAAFVVFLIS
jgi:hypothetical protein